MNITIKTILASSCLILCGQAQAATADVVGNFNVLFEVAQVFSAFLGFLLFSSGVYGFYSHSKSGGSQGNSPGKNFVKMLIGSFLVAIPFTYSLLKNSFGASNGAGEVNVDGGQMLLALDSSVAAQAQQIGGFLARIPQGTITAILAFVFFIGFIAMISGIYSFKDVGDPHASKGAPILSPALRVVGGIVCMNIIWFSCVVSDLIGISALCLSS